MESSLEIKIIIEIKRRRIFSKNFFHPIGVLFISEEKHPQLISIPRIIVISTKTVNISMLKDIRKEEALINIPNIINKPMISSNHGKIIAIILIRNIGNNL